MGDPSLSPHRQLQQSRSAGYLPKDNSVDPRQSPGQMRPPPGAPVTGFRQPMQGNIPMRGPPPNHNGLYPTSQNGPYPTAQNRPYPSAQNGPYPTTQTGPYPTSQDGPYPPPHGMAPNQGPPYDAMTGQNIHPNMRNAQQQQQQQQYSNAQPRWV